MEKVRLYTLRRHFGLLFVRRFPWDGLLHKSLSSSLESKPGSSRWANTHTHTHIKCRYQPLVSFLSHSFLVVSPCNSPACQRASVHLSISADPFAHPCDYFLFSCAPDRPSSSKVRRGKSRRDVKEKRTLDRKTELLQYLREILGKESCVILDDSNKTQMKGGFFSLDRVHF